MSTIRHTRRPPLWGEWRLSHNGFSPTEFQIDEFLPDGGPSVCLIADRGVSYGPFCRTPTRMLCLLPQNGGAHGAPARSGAGIGHPQSTEPWCGAEPRSVFRSSFAVLRTQHVAPSTSHEEPLPPVRQRQVRPLSDLASRRQSVRLRLLRECCSRCRLAREM